VRYADSPIVCTPDTEAPSWNRRAFVHTVRPRHRSPNIVVAEDETLFDRFGPGFTVVDAICGQATRSGCSTKPTSSACRSVTKLSTTRGCASCTAVSFTIARTQSYSAAAETGQASTVLAATDGGLGQLSATLTLALVSFNEFEKQFAHRL
jgi:hypothetical protein